MDENEIYLEDSSILPFGLYKKIEDRNIKVPVDFAINENKNIIVNSEIVSRNNGWISKDNTAIIIKNLVFKINNIETYWTSWYHCIVVAEIENE